MALDDPTLKILARDLAEEIFVTPNTVAHSDTDQIVEAMRRIDTVMNSTITELEANYKDIPIIDVLRNEIVAAAPEFTSEQAGSAISLWTRSQVSVKKDDGGIGVLEAGVK